jgi:hypothetical protein
MAQNTGILKIAEPTIENTKTPFATVACLLPKSLPKGHVGQTKLCDAFSFSLFRCRLSSRFVFNSGMKRSTPLSKQSIIVPSGQIQPQNTFPKMKIGITKTRTAIIVARRFGNNDNPGGALLVSTA